MAKHYVTFGHSHAHEINGKHLDKDSVACFEADDWEVGRGIAFGLFGDKFFTDYHGDEFNMSNLEWFPRGIIDLDEAE